MPKSANHPLFEDWTQNLWIYLFVNIKYQNIENSKNENIFKITRSDGKVSCNIFNKFPGYLENVSNDGSY